ncbi:MAG: transglutaminase TgpA family protein [Isosphaeraceae bacterium]
MNSNLIYRTSFYVMLSAATAILCGESTDSRIDWLLPTIVSAVGVLTLLMVDRNGQWGIPRDLADVLALGTLGILFLEYSADETQVIHALGHWLVYLQLIWYFLPKKTRDDWILFLIGLTQVLIGSVINQGDVVGAWLFLWAMLAVWVLGLFFLQREAGRFSDEYSAAGGVLRLTADDPYRGLFDLPFLAASGRVLTLTLVLGGLFFLLLPRQTGATRARSSAGMAKHLTGFDDEVRLGQLGEILENDSVVMSVEFTDELGKSVQPADEPLWRGVTLSNYERGRWRRALQRSRQMIVALRPFKNDPEKPRVVIRQYIKLEANDSPSLFAMRPILELKGPATNRLPPSMSPADGTIWRPESRGSYDYTVLSDTNIQAPQEGELPPSADGIRVFEEMDEDLRAHLARIALPLVKNLPSKGPEAILARCQALEVYLRDSGIFSYSLQMDVVDPTIDPVEDFLINRKKGHCEYFSSALCLLLRSIGIPARVVNGFKGGDWNQLTRSMNVRQKHAHSWVEAYVGREANGAAHWVTLDPTPGISRDESVAQVGGLAALLRPITDILRYIWVFYVLGYDSARQNRLLYNPITYTVRRVRDGYITLWHWTKDTAIGLFHFQSIGSFISVRGFIVSFLVLLLAALLFRLVSWLLRRLLRFWRGPDEDEAALTPGILFYRRLAQLLAEFELERSPAETQNEFALRAARFLTGKSAQTRVVADVPERIVEAFYRVRFGRQQLDQETLRDLEHNLDLLERSVVASC